MKTHLICLLSAFVMSTLSGCTTSPETPPGSVMTATSSIADFEYFPETKTLHAHFKTGTYEYKNVPLETFRAMQKAESTGRAFNEHIKGIYPGVRVEE